MAKTVTIRPTALFYRKSTSYWSSYANAYDGNESTRASSCNSGARFKIDLSSIPSNAVIKSGKIRILYYRTGSTSAIPFGGFNYYAGKTSDSSENQLSNKSASLTGYHSKEWTETAVFNFTEAEQTAWRNAGTPCIWVNGSDGYVYEIEAVITYEEPSKIYPGGNQASAVYVGSTKAQAVYLGNTKII